MTGAIEFLKAWRDICNEREECQGCPVTICHEYAVGCPFANDEKLTELVRQVMAERRKNEYSQIQR